MQGVFVVVASPRRKEIHRVNNSCEACRHNPCRCWQREIKNAEMNGEHIRRFSPDPRIDEIVESKLIFVSVRQAVMLGSRHICTAISATMAKRIAKALNHYIPNQRGS
jgi:hypothetical protein